MEKNFGVSNRIHHMATDNKYCATPCWNRLSKTLSFKGKKKLSTHSCSRIYQQEIYCIERTKSSFVWQPLVYQSKSSNIGTAKQNGNDKRTHQKSGRKLTYTQFTTPVKILDSKLLLAKDMVWHPPTHWKNQTFWNMERWYLMETLSLDKPYIHIVY